MTAHGDPKLADAFRWCRDVTRRRARNFYYGLKLTPEPQRSALYAIYAWMRRADDLVDAAGDGDDPRGELAAFRSATDAALGGRAPGGDPLWTALAATAEHFDVDRAALHTMIEGQIGDVAARQFRSFDDVRDYCYRVASTVGLLCIGIWGYRDPAARDLAVDRGIAFQLTNILRDYREDYDAGRVYLPIDDFDRHGITPAVLRRWGDPAPCSRFTLEQAARARSYYRRSAALEEMITPSCRPTLWAMTRIYERLLFKIEREPARIISGHRLRLSSWRKGAIALRARWLGRHGAESRAAMEA